MNLNIGSFKSIVKKNCDSAVVYGRYDCKYQDVKKCIESHLKKTFDYTLGDTTLTHTGPNQRREFYKIKTKNNFTSICKAGLTNVVLENYRRTKEGLPIIPIIFCIESEISFLQTHKPESYQPASVVLGRRITDSEIRRSFKLFTEFNEDITKVVKETFKFIRLQYSNINKNFFDLIQTDPSWDSKEWKEAWCERKTRVKSNKRASSCQADWRVQFLEQIKKIDQEFTMKNYILV